MATEAKQAVARLDWRTVMSAAPDTPADVISALDRYFEPFAQPVRRDGNPESEMLCLECEKPLTGLSSAFLGGGFTWGLTHGEGFCMGCRWPARAHHYIKNVDGGELMTVRNFVLQYHPDFVERKSQ